MWFEEIALYSSNYEGPVTARMKFAGFGTSNNVQNHCQRLKTMGFRQKRLQTMECLSCYMWMCLWWLRIWLFLRYLATFLVIHFVSTYKFSEKKNEIAS